VKQIGKRRPPGRSPKQVAGVTLVELMVALSIGSFLIIGAVQVYNQSRQAYVINESIARVQETAQFAMDTIEADLRMASNWGKHSRGDAVEGRFLLDDDVNPLGLTLPATDCGDGWVLDLERPIAGFNNTYALACPPEGAAQDGSDTLTVRRAAADTSKLPLVPGRLRIQTTRIQGELFDDGVIPPGFDPDPDVSETHDLIVNSYYVAKDSELLGAGVPTLRRHTLSAAGGAPTIVDQEVAPGIENFQVQFGVDVDQDNSIDRYVNPGDPILDPAEAGYIPAARVMTARVWLVVRSVDREQGVVNRPYQPGDVSLDAATDDHRRLQVSKTILLRNART
jgi:type IV pilus assembly protein PilW